MKGVRWLGLVGRLAAVGVGGAVVYRFLLRPWHLRWGATDEEVARPMPGDEVLPEPRVSSTRAVTVHAGPEHIWPWLLQLGRGRGGFYSYEWLEAMIGTDITNSDRILPEFQHLAPGDEIPTGPGTSMRVRTVETERFLVFGPAPGEPSDTSTITWAIGLYPRGDGTTRLVSRLRYDFGWKPGEPLFMLFFEPGQFVMDQKMLRTLRKRAEALAAQQRTRAPERTPPSALEPTPPSLH
jgi:hypothetical protein